MVVLNLDGKNFSEIAVILDITKQAVRKSYYSVVKKAQKVVVKCPISRRTTLTEQRQICE